MNPDSWSGNQSAAPSRGVVIEGKCVMALDFMALEFASWGSNAAVPRRSRVTALWHIVVSELRDRYQPERHYMRGPGPKWHAKHGALASRAYH